MLFSVDFWLLGRQGVNHVEKVKAAYPPHKHHTVFFMSLCVTDLGGLCL